MNDSDGIVCVIRLTGLIVCCVCAFRLRECRYFEMRSHGCCHVECKQKQLKRTEVTDPEQWCENSFLLHMPSVLDTLFRMAARAYEMDR